MLGSKTAVKKPWSSLRLDQDTPPLEYRPPRTQCFRNETVSMRYGDTTRHFKLYQDCYIGINANSTDCPIPLIPMDADEDCETTESLLRFGTNLCIRDLKQSILIPR